MPSVCPSVRPSVCPSVTLVDQDHIGWKSGKLIARTISPTPSPFVAQRTSTQENMGTFWGDYRGGVGNSGVLEHKSGNISETRKDRGKLLLRAYRNSQTLFRTVSSRPPTASSSPRLGVRNPHPKLQLLSYQERVKLQTSNLTVHSEGPSEQRPIKNFAEKGA